MYHVNQVPYDETLTQGGISYYHNKELIRLDAAYYALRHKFKLRSVDMFKHRFGRQQKCVNYTHRCWVWTFNWDDVVIYALVDIRGPHWESPEPYAEGTLQLLGELLTALSDESAYV